MRAKKTKNGYEIELGKDYGTVRTVWQDSRYDANEYGTKLVHALVSGIHFDFPKSIYNTYDCIAPVLYERKNAIVLDFFAGSGTTGHAVLELNKEDDGNRQFILCTNNENNNGNGHGGVAQKVCYPRISKVIKGYTNSKNQKVSGFGGNLRYYTTELVENVKTDNDKRVLTSRSIVAQFV